MTKPALLRMPLPYLLLPPQGKKEKNGHKLDSLLLAGEFNPRDTVQVDLENGKLRFGKSQ